MSQKLIYPQPPKGGLIKRCLSISPPRLRVAATAEQGLGDLGVDLRKLDF
jgi:hypothetical protein